MYGQQSASAGAGPDHHSYYLSNSSPSIGNSNFPSPLFFDSSFTDSPQHLQSATKLSPSSNHPTAVTNLGQDSLRNAKEAPQQRSLPSRNVSAEDIADSFVGFILYCNPQFGLDVDTSDLRSSFLSPPKSDDNSFHTFDLFRLIEKLDSKEIKTWGQLALDLGVQPPDVSKGQSSQKVQQYTVRLKRWMRAMHIDAFFEFLLGKQHIYFTDIPPLSNPYPAAGRDGVLAEEDLAIRAIDPNFRPKRGRRRNSDIEQEATEGLDKPPQEPNSSFPQSGHPDHFSGNPWAIASAVTPQSLAPWSARTPHSAATTTVPSNLRWQLQGPPGNNPSTPHPLSAIPTTMASHIDAAFDNEPQSATTPSSRKRRRHGPAVSSAWTSTLNPGAKPRGRPPASRSLQEGPYGTFPSRPSVERSPKTPARELETGLQERDEAVHPPVMPPPPPYRQNSNGSTGGKRMSLSLKVPENVGRPVRLATPPPTLLVNGESDLNENPALQRDDYPSSDSGRDLAESEPTRVSQNSHDTSNNFDFESMKRVLTSDLLRAELVGRATRLTGDEARRLAQAMLERLHVAQSLPGSNASNGEVARLTAASWLGLGNLLNVPLGLAISPGKKIRVAYFRTDVDGYEDPVSAQEVEAPPADNGIREIFSVCWRVSMGACAGQFDMKDIELGRHSQGVLEDEHDAVLRYITEAADNVGAKNGRWAGEAVTDFARRHLQHAGDANDDDGIDWKARYKAMEFGTKIVRGELNRVKARILENVLDALA
ncbi:hypothetical protein K431DRAFT_278181 [Polychaeton citri CBS 116435]|uniref:ARS binding protein 2 n=1 Tax=Polychaeton citri CBS 116435 TaxID=1314669 RepID=A0A9P4Q1K5_9PEZI|nr:hypothetical protein K431DRAFT_278181 [Polychaeton citri CBS 116435]